MICRCFGRELDLAALGRRVGQTAQLMVGVPDYDTYLAHMRAHHPDQLPLDEKRFFRERQAARYGGSGTLRCC